MVGKWWMRWLIVSVVACGIGSPALAADAAAPRSPSTVALLGKDFQFTGDWVVQTEFHRTVLFAPPSGVRHPAAAAIVLPRAGKYRVWVAAKDFPDDRPGTRTFSVSIAGKRLESVFGRSGRGEYEFEDGGSLDLAAGPTLVVLDKAKPFARLHGLVLTTDDRFRPTKPITPTAYAPAKLHPLAPAAATDVAVTPLQVEGAPPLAVLANEHVHYEFRAARRGPLATVAVTVKLKEANGWRDLDIDPDAEGYFIHHAPADTKLAFSGFYPRWTRSDIKPMTVEAGGVQVVTTAGHTTHSLAEVGTRTQLFAKSAVAKGNRVHLEFHPSRAGQLRATWQLLPGQRWADVELSLSGAPEGQVSLGYESFFRRDPAQVAEVLLPMMYQRKRLPEAAVTLLSNAAPTPLTLVQPCGDRPATLALIADPRDLPFEWPDGRRAPYGLAIRGPSATVQPAIYGPVIGTPNAAPQDGGVRMRFKLLVQSGDWYPAFRTAVDDVFAVRDYRQNIGTSLSDAVLNMIDLYLNDEHGGWWERAKASYQIESKNGSTHAAPLLPLSLYRLTGDRALLERRALPTLAFMLSRDNAHFSPVPEDTGRYPAGSMNGPVKLFGTTTYAGLWELSARRSPAFLEIAAPQGNPRPTAGYSHGGTFNEYLARYQLAGDPQDLQKACELADAYIKSAIATAAHKDLGPQPFFFISFVPDWEGLLRLYEFTGKQPYLDAAVFGARQLMTGLWTQPVIPEGKVTVHPTGQYDDHPGHAWWKGPERFRLGTPRKPNDTPAHEVPAWIVSNVGLGFEQPITYRSSGAGRLIWQMGFSAHFLRLYRYTQDRAFLTCARNAVVGRWANYPGYYITGLTDLPQNPRYPLTGPDVTEFYYHHIAPHLAWSIDYLVSEAEMLSNGAIAFPSLRQYGYAYFDSRIFGHAPGKVYDEPAWLLFRRDVITIDNAQINTLLAWNKDRLHIVLTNQSQEAQDATLMPGAKLHAEPGQVQAALRLGAAAPAALSVDAAGRVKVKVGARGLATVTLSNVRVEPPALPQFAEGRKTTAAMLSLATGPTQTRAAAIQVEPGAWLAYVWSTASPQQTRSATLRYQLSGQEHTLSKNEYPFEFLVPVSAGQQAFRFELDLNQPDGKTLTSPPGELRQDCD